MVISDIYLKMDDNGRPVEVHKNYTSGSGIEVNPERQNLDFTTKLS